MPARRYRINYSHLLCFASLKWEFSVTVRYPKARTVTSTFPGAVTTFQLPRARTRKHEPDINRTPARPQDTKTRLNLRKIPPNGTQGTQGNRIKLTKGSPLKRAKHNPTPAPRKDQHRERRTRANEPYTKKTHGYPPTHLARRARMPTRQFALVRLHRNPIRVVDTR